MKNLILYFFILTLAISCKTRGQENTDGLTSGKSEKTEKIKGVRFDFVAERLNTSIETIIVKATLYNDNIDTVYFLTTTCGGEQYSVRYDNSKFWFTPYLNCNTSVPRIGKIAPKGRYDFKIHFQNNQLEPKMKLGFDFYQVENSFKINNKSVGDINIFNRNSDEQTIIWSDKKTII